MKHRYMVVLIVVVLAAMGSVREARADVAPPQPPPGASVGSGDPSTYVQMVSENVLMEITDYDGPPFRDNFGGTSLASNMMVGHVQASFKMANQGTNTETLDVRFPLGAPDGFSDVMPLENFTAYVDGQVAKTQTIEQANEWNTIVPWATWQATFAPGQTVTLSVDYDVHPEGYAPWGTFTYILETGAGWYGPIGEGTITFRLPYEINELNTGLDPETRGAPSPGNYTITGIDIIWRFTDLEPTRESNIHLTVLPPSAWQRIEQAQTSAKANPDSVDAQLELARALHSALSFFKVGPDEVGSSVTLAKQAEEAYRRALELAPDNIDGSIEYLDLMLSLWQPATPSTQSEDLLAVLERVKELAPNDPRVLELQQWFEGLQRDENHFQHQPETMTAMAIAGPTNTPNANEAMALTAMAGSDLTPAPASTPDLASTPVPVLTSVPTPVPLVASTSLSNTSPKIGVWVVVAPVIAICAAAVIGGALVGVWAYRRKRPAK